MLMSIGRNRPDRKPFGHISPVQPVHRLVVVEKMHLWALAFEVENSIVALRQRRNNFPFASVERHIYRK